jgi:hypothetical protein
MSIKRKFRKALGESKAQNSQALVVRKEEPVTGYSLADQVAAWSR